jgi:hypothetical protein
MCGIDFFKIADALDTGRKERRVAERLEHRLAGCSYRNFTGDIQSNSFD